MTFNSNACKQDLKNTSSGFKKIANEAENLYINPFTKRSSFSLTTPSLEMCTEILGSETGSSIDLNQDEYSYFMPQKQSSCRINELKTREICKEIRYSKSFPPPLLSSINGVKVESHREDGRLLITAVSFSTRNYLKAEREKGTLRLFLVKGGSAATIEEEDEEKVRHRRGGKDLFSKRCNGDGSRKLPTLPVCVAFS